LFQDTLWRVSFCLSAWKRERNIEWATFIV
jgi:hypothetical protein